jgi:hypothetical protein
MDAVLRIPEPAGDYSDPFINAGLSDWIRSAQQWLWLLLATYWHDVFAHYSELDPSPTTFHESFWTRWQTINDEFRLLRTSLKVAEFFSTDRTLTTDQANRLLSQYSEISSIYRCARHRWKKRNPRGCIDLRQKLLDSQTALTIIGPKASLSDEQQALLDVVKGIYHRSWESDEVVDRPE